MKLNLGAPEQLNFEYNDRRKKILPNKVQLSKPNTHRASYIEQLNVEYKIEERR